MRMRGWLVGILGVGLVGRVVAAPKPIDPATLAGEWSGTWENRSFTPHPTGNVIASITTPDAEHVVIEGTGTCGGGGPSWSAKAKYRAPTFAVKMKIRLPGKIAKTTITLAKQ